MDIVKKIKDWYQGRYVPPPPNDPDSLVSFVSPGYYEQPPIAKLLNVLGKFFLAHWQWIIGTFLVIVGIIIAL